MALVGNTVRLKALFRGWDGDPASPSDVKLKIFSRGRQQLGEDIIPENVGSGEYQHDFVVPDHPGGYLQYEFSGMLEGTPVVSRGHLSKKWI